MCTAYLIFLPQMILPVSFSSKFYGQKHLGQKDRRRQELQTFTPRVFHFFAPDVSARPG